MSEDRVTETIKAVPEYYNTPLAEQVPDRFISNEDTLLRENTRRDFVLKTQDNTRMTLPIDPTQIDPADIGEEQATLEMSHEDAIEHVRDVFTDAGFGVPVEFSPSEMLNEKVDAGRDPYYVLGACNPEVADRALDATDNKLGALMACNVVIWEQEPGKQVVYHVSIMRIARLVGMAPDNEEMADIVADTGELVDEAFANL